MEWSIIKSLLLAAVGCIVTLFGWSLSRKHKFDNSLLGLFVIGIILIVLAIIQPKSIEVDINALKIAEQKSELALEIASMAAWNVGQYTHNEKTQIIAKEVLGTLYGKEKSEDYQSFFQNKGLYRVPEDQFKGNAQNESFPAIKSQLYNLYMKSLEEGGQKDNKFKK